LAHVFPWEYIYKGLKLAQLPGQLGVFLTCGYASDGKSVSLVSSEFSME
jgi:hypothetical protein